MLPDESLSNYLVKVAATVDPLIMYRTVSRFLERLPPTVKIINEFPYVGENGDTGYDVTLKNLHTGSTSNFIIVGPTAHDDNWYYRVDVGKRTGSDRHQNMALTPEGLLAKIVPLLTSFASVSHHVETKSTKLLGSPSKFKTVREEVGSKRARTAA